jgi:hypothetical protein
MPVTKAAETRPPLPLKKEESALTKQEYVSTTITGKQSPFCIR